MQSSTRFARYPYNRTRCPATGNTIYYRDDQDPDVLIQRSIQKAEKQRANAANASR